MGRLWKWLCVGCVAVLLFLGASHLGVWESLLVSLGRWLVVETPLREVDLVVALGGDRGRQVMAVEILRQGLARQVLFTGADVQPHDYQCLGVPVGQAMALPGAVYTTYEEAVAIRQIVQSHQLGSVLIVTSATIHDERIGRSSRCSEVLESSCLWLRCLPEASRWMPGGRAIWGENRCS